MHCFMWFALTGRNQYTSISFISFSDEAVVFMVVTSVGSKDI